MFIFRCKTQSQTTQVETNFEITKMLLDMLSMNEKRNGIQLRSEFEWGQDTYQPPYDSLWINNETMLWFRFEQSYKFVSICSCFFFFLVVELQGEGTEKKMAIARLW